MRNRKSGGVGDGESDLASYSISPVPGNATHFEHAIPPLQQALAPVRLMAGLRIYHTD